MELALDLVAFRGELVAGARVAGARARGRCVGCGCRGSTDARGGARDLARIERVFGFDHAAPYPGAS